MIKKIIRRRLQIPSFELNRHTGYKPKVWLTGDGRSGTTWISSLINNDKYFREVFEPFHPSFIPQMDFLSSHYYVRPNEENEKLYNISQKVFSGGLWNSRTDQENQIRIYKGLFVKDIFSNLFSNWVFHNFNDLKIILLIRNPFAVAASKYLKKDWIWVTDPMTLYNQDSLRKDHLKDHEDLIKRISNEGNYILKQILIWSIIHYVPFRQFKTDQIHLMFYENMYTNPQEELSKLSGYIGKEIEHISKEAFNKPSRVVGDNFSKGKSPITSWKNDLPSSTIDEGMKILESFGLVDLYNQSSIPNEFNLDDF